MGDAQPTGSSTARGGVSTGEDSPETYTLAVRPPIHGAIRMRSIATILIGLSLTSAPASGQARWNVFRGPGSQGVAPDSEALPVRFGPAENVLWKVSVGAGHSSPCIWDDRVFVTSWDQVASAFRTLCLDRTTGKERWRRDVKVDAIERVHRVNSPASSTPATDGKRVFSYFGSYGLVCHDNDGRELWTKKLPRLRNIFGTAASPIVHDGKVILNRDTNEDSRLWVLDAATGREVWVKDRSGFPSGWSTPVVWKRDGVTELLVYGAFRLTAYDLADGAERWSVPGLADEPCITPVHGDGLVFVSSYNMRTNPEVIGLPDWKTLTGRYDADENGTLSREEVKDNKSILSRLDADGEGDHPLRGFFRFLDKDRNGQLDEKEWQGMFDWMSTFKHANGLIAIKPGTATKDAEIVWQHGRGVPECPSPLYHDGRVYIVKNGGLMTCLDARTGAVKYFGRIKARGPRYASPVIGDGKIYLPSARGQITVVAAGDELRILAQNDLKERVMATPALVDGKVYVRTEKHLYAFGSPSK